MKKIKNKLMVFFQNYRLAKIVCISLERDAGANLWTAASAF